MICNLTLLANIYEIIRNIPESPTLALWPLLLLIGGVLVATVTIIIIATDTTTVEGKTMCVLGMQEAGKTKFYMNLQGKSYNDYVATNKDDIPDFDFYYNDRKIRVKKGMDINGTTLAIKPYYEKLIKENEIIFFLFNVKKYFYDSDYAFEVRVRMEMIWRKFQDKAEAKSHVVTLATHIDLLGDSEKKSVIKKLQESVQGKPYSSMFENNLLAVDLTSKDFMKELEKHKIF